MDYAGNSHKDKDPKKPEKKLEKVVTGAVIQKPKGPGRKFKDVFLGGDAKAVGRYIISDVLLPALRNLAYDMISRGSERMIFGEKDPRRANPRYVNYGAQYSFNPSPQRSPFDTRPIQSAVPRGRINRHEISDIIVASKEDAEEVVERLSDVLEAYQVVSLADLYDLLGLEISHIDYKWGWTHIRDIPIRSTREGFLLELPPLEEI